MNRNFLNHIKDEELINQLPGYLLWKDMNSTFQKSNFATAKLFGYKDIDHLIGTTDYDIRCEAAKFADSFVKQDEKLKSQGKPLTLLAVHPYQKGEIKVLLLTKSLVRDKLEVPVGIVCYCMELQNSILNQIGLYLYQQKTSQKIKQPRLGASFYINYQPKQINLSERQQECLFYLLRGKSAETIGKILQISRRTVESHVEIIKLKMECHNKADIIEKSLQLGFNEILPRRILKTMLSEKN